MIIASDAVIIIHMTIMGYKELFSVVRVHYIIIVCRYFKLLKDRNRCLDKNQGIDDMYMIIIEIDKEMGVSIILKS